MKINELKKLIKNFDDNVIYNADLKKRNWFNIGGKAKVFFKANDLKELVEFLKILDNREKIHIIGAGSNTLFTDEVYDGVIIKLGNNFSRLSILNNNIIIFLHLLLQLLPVLLLFLLLLFYLQVYDL